MGAKFQLLIGCLLAGFATTYGNDPTQQVNVTCGQNTSITLGNQELEVLNADIGDELYIATEVVTDLESVLDHCQLEVTSNSTTFEFSLTECPHIIQMVDETLNYTFLIFRASNFTEGSGTGADEPSFDETDLTEMFEYRQSPEICIAISCSFNSKLEVIGGPVIPQITEYTHTVEPVSGVFEVDLDLFYDDNYEELIGRGGTVAEPNDIYVRATLANTPNNFTDFVMQIEDCWATLTSNPTTEPLYDIIEDGCPEVGPDVLSIDRNFDTTFGKFRFQSFLWSGVDSDEQSIYLHCAVTICDDMVPGSACRLQPDCEDTSVRKRRASSESSKTITTGPIYVTSSNLYCTEDNGKCSDICVTQNGRATCRCRETNRRLSEDGRTCYDVSEDTMHVEVKDNDSSTICILALAMVVLVVLNAFLAQHLVRLFSKSSKLSPPDA